MFEAHLLVKEKTVYVDLLGIEHKTKRDAEEANHNIHLKFREYLKKLIKTFDDDRVDMNRTTKSLWDKLTFTDDCIRSSCLNVDMSNLKVEDISEDVFMDDFIDDSNSNINIG